MLLRCRPNIDEDADEDDDESGDVNAVSISPKHVQDVQLQPQDHTDPTGPSDGKRKRAPMRSHSRSYDEEEEEHQAGMNSQFAQCICGQVQMVKCIPTAGAVCLTHTS